MAEALRTLRSRKEAKGMGVPVPSRQAISAAHASAAGLAKRTSARRNRIRTGHPALAILRAPRLEAFLFEALAFLAAVRVAAAAGLPVPFLGLRLVLGNALAFAVHAAKPALRRGMALVRGLPEPFDALGLVLPYALSGHVPVGQGALRLGIPSLRLQRRDVLNWIVAGTV